MSATTLLINVLVLVAWSAFAVWTVRRLWPLSQSDPSLRFGVRVCGVLLWLASTVIWTIKDSRSSSHIFFHALLNGLLTLPGSLWAGYWWGRRMRRIVGVGGQNR